MELHEMNFQILENASNAIKPNNSKLIFTTLNGLFPLFHSVKDFIASEKKDRIIEYPDNTFDLMSFRDHTDITYCG